MQVIENVLGFWIFLAVDSGFQVLDLDSSLKELGFWILLISEIPNALS